MFRFTLAALTLIFLTCPQIAFSQNIPAYRWDKEVDGSDLDSFAGLGVDAQGNTYIAGSTFSLTFPVKAAIQNQSASAGLYRIDGPGSAYTNLGLISATSIVVDPLNPNTLYATSNGPLPGTGSQSAGGLVRSTDGGVRFNQVPLASFQVLAVAINPLNDQILYAATYDQGVLESADAGATWTAINNGLTAHEGKVAILGVWIDPTTPNVLFANGPGSGLTGLVRSADGGASWQTVQTWQGIGLTQPVSLYFDTANPGTLYVTINQVPFKSSDHGQTFTALTPAPFYVGGFSSIISDPNHPGRLLAAGAGIFESDDGGNSWTQKTTTQFVHNAPPLVPDWANGFLYTLAAPYTVLRISSDLQTTTPVGPPEIGIVDGTSGIAVANGHVYVAVNGTRDVYVTKLDPLGNVVYCTYFGGSDDDIATAMTVDQAGSVYVAGTTTSLDFPATNGAFASTGGSFLFKLNPDGTLGYSTYFAPAPATPAAIAVDTAGSVYLAGSTYSNNLPFTPGALLTTLPLPQGGGLGFFSIFTSNGFVTKFDPTASSLVYSTYIGGTAQAPNLVPVINAIALSTDGSAYLGGQNGIYHLNATGSSLLAALPPMIDAQTMAVGPDGSLYIAGIAGTGNNQFETTTGAFEANPQPPSPGQSGSLPANAVVKMDAQLVGVQAATYFGPVGPYTQFDAMMTDLAGNVYLGGQTPPPGLPTRTPFQEGFSQLTGFLSELSGDLSTLLFSSYLGDTELFAVKGVAIDPSGNVLIGGSTGFLYYPGGNLYVNSLTLAPPPALRIDAVENAASLLDGPISAGETIVVQGAGFGNDAQLSIGGTAVPLISITPQQLLRSCHGVSSSALQRFRCNLAERIPITFWFR
jgi:hypothetical protein